MKRIAKRGISSILAFIMAISIPVSVFAADAETLPNLPTEREEEPPTEPNILDLPISMFEIYGSAMDRGVLAAVVTNGVFLTWRTFPQENFGFQAEGPNRGLRGDNFVIYRDGVRITPNPIFDSTNFIDPTGTINSEYIIVTVDDDGEYLHRTVAQKAVQATATAGTGHGYFLEIELTPPAPVVLPSNTVLGGTQTVEYFPDEIQVADLTGDGTLDFVIKWQNQNPDVIQSGFTAPPIFQAMRLDGTIMWEINAGINIRAGQHYLQPMLYDFDGDGRAEIMFQTAPGTVDGLGRTLNMDGEFVFGDVEIQDFRQRDRIFWNRAERIIRGNNPDGNAGGGAITPAIFDAATAEQQAAAAAEIEKGEFFQNMVQFFMEWPIHPDVIKRSYWGNISGEVEPTFLPDEDPEEAKGVHIGWWVSPPQVMLGMYTTGRVCPITGNVATANGPTHAYDHARRSNSAQVNNNPANFRQAPGWTQENFDLLNSLPKCPVEFRRMFETGLPENIATALTWQWYQLTFFRRQANYDNDRGLIQFGHVMDTPEFFTVFDGRTGEALDTVPYAVPIEEIRPDGSMVRGGSIRWNDWTFAQPEPWNRSHRFLGAVAHLDGHGTNTASSVQIRGYYSRGSVSAYSWDGKELTGEVIWDSGFEVMPNPFIAHDNYFNGQYQANRHGAPGRFELAFDPANPTGYREGFTFADGYGSATIQGQHSMYVYNDGRIHNPKNPPADDPESLVCGLSCGFVACGLWPRAADCRLCGVVFGGWGDCMIFAKSIDTVYFYDIMNINDKNRIYSYISKIKFRERICVGIY